MKAVKNVLRRFAKKTSYIVAGLLFVLILAGCTKQTAAPASEQAPISSPAQSVSSENAPIVRDANGCLTSVGDIWCDVLQKCYRPGVEPCELKDDHGCLTSDGLFWCEKQQKCYDPKIDFCDTTKIFCSDAQRKATSCGRFSSPICAWLVDDGKCQNALCIVSFSNVCSACMNPAVKYYTLGSCPAQKLQQ